MIAAIATWVGHRTVALRHSRAFRLFALGRLCSHTGNGAHTVAVGWWTWQVSGGNAVALGAVLACQFAPQLLGAPVAGALVDRWRRRPAMLVQQACALVLAATLAVMALGGAGHLWVIYVVMLAVGISTAFSNPLQQSLLGEMVPAGPARQGAVALNSTTFQLGSLVGAGLAGMLGPVLGAGGVMLISPATYVISLATLVMIRPSDLDSPPVDTAHGPGIGAAWGRMVTDIAEGVRYLRTTPELGVALALSAAVGALGMGTLQTGAQVLVMTHHAATTQQEAVVLGWVAAAVAGGGIASQLHIAGAATPRTVTLVGYVVVLGSALVAAALVGPLAALLGCVTVAAWTAFGHQTLAQTILQSAPDHLKGRISGIWFAAGSGSKALAGPTSGGLASLLGPVGGMLTTGLLLIAAATLVLFLHRPHTTPCTD